MTTVTEVINSLAERGVALEPAGPDKILVNGISKITEQEKAMLKANKAIILEALQAVSAEHAEQSPSYRLEILDGLPLLSGDRKFIRQRLRLIPTVSHEKVLRIYRNRFIDGVDKEHAPHKKDNAGRYRANTWLLDITNQSN